MGINLHHVYIVNNKIFYSGRVGETNPCPQWNPQTEFTSVEENRAFQACDGTQQFIPLFLKQKKLEPIGSSFFYTRQRV